MKCNSRILDKSYYITFILAKICERMMTRDKSSVFKVCSKYSS